MKKTPEQIVDLQIQYYNQRDLLGFVSTYHEDIEIFDYGSPKPKIKGLEQLRTVYQSVLQKSGLHAAIEKRISKNSYVIDHECATWDGQEHPVRVVVIYEVLDQKIKRVWMIK